MRIIAFDLGRNMAWAHNANGVLTWGNQEYDGLRPVRFAATMVDLTKLLESHNPKCEVLVYETPFTRGRDATRSLWGLAGILETCATMADLAVVDVAVPTIKKFATGNGKASKDQMIRAAKGFGYKGNNEHEADAVCLLRYAERNLERG